MRGDQTSWSHLPGLGGTSGISFLSRPMTCDYRVATMELREQVTAGRRPPTRRTRLNLKSAPPFQNRNPDNFPMAHNREDAVQSAKGHRLGKKTFQETMLRAKTDIVSLKQYSKQMFDVALENTDARTTGSNTPTASRPYSTVSSNKDRKSSVSSETNNGPTVEGSMLYNRRQKVMNSIQTRPYSESAAPQYNHERSKSRPNLTEAMHQMSVAYTVRHSSMGLRPGSVMAGSSVTDYVFVPRSEVDEEDGPRHKLMTDTAFSEFDESFDMEGDAEVFDDFEDLEEQSKVQHGEFRNGIITRLLPPTIPCGLRLVSLDEDTSSESSHDMDEEKREQQAQETKKTEPQKAQDRKSTGKGGKNAPPPVPEPEVEKPEKVKIVLKGPHCWVDDATVSSDQSDQVLEEEAVQNPSPDDKKVQGRENVDKHLPVCPIKDGEVAPVDNGKVKEEDMKDNDKDDVDSADIKVYQLPSFLCPSSERKSREAAIKDWLAKTSFRHSNRTVPIL